MFHFYIQMPNITDYVQAIAACIGIYFLIINLRRTNKNIEFQSLALRNSMRPIISVIDPTEIKQSGVFERFAIKVEGNDAIDVRIDAVESDTIEFFDSKNKIFLFPRIAKDGQAILMYKVKDNALNPSDIFDSEEERIELVKSYDIILKISFQDEGGYKYRQRLTGNAMFSGFILEKVEFVK